MTSIPEIAQDTDELRAELCRITKEKSLIDEIEGQIDSRRKAEDHERALSRSKEDVRIREERAAEDEQRDRRQDELCRREIVSIL